MLLPTLFYIGAITAAYSIDNRSEVINPSNLSAEQDLNDQNSTDRSFKIASSALSGTTVTYSAVHHPITPKMWDVFKREFNRQCAINFIHDSIYEFSLQEVRKENELLQSVVDQKHQQARYDGKVTEQEAAALQRHIDFINKSLSTNRTQKRRVATSVQKQVSEPPQYNGLIYHRYEFNVENSVSRRNVQICADKVMARLGFKNASGVKPVRDYSTRQVRLQEVVGQCSWVERDVVPRSLNNLTFAQQCATVGAGVPKGASMAIKSTSFESAYKTALAFRLKAPSAPLTTSVHQSENNQETANPYSVDKTGRNSSYIGISRNAENQRNKPSSENNTILASLPNRLPIILNETSNEAAMRSALTGARKEQHFRAGNQRAVQAIVGLDRAHSIGKAYADYSNGNSLGAISTAIGQSIVEITDKALYSKVARGIRYDPAGVIVSGACNAAISLGSDGIASFSVNTAADVAQHYRALDGLALGEKLSLVSRKTCPADRSCRRDNDHPIIDNNFCNDYNYVPECLARNGG